MLSKTSLWNSTLVFFVETSGPNFWFHACGTDCGLRGQQIALQFEKPEKLSKSGLLQWITKGDANFWAMQRIDSMTISLRCLLPTSELQWHDMKNNPFYWATRASQSCSFAHLIVKFLIGLLRERKHPNVFFFSCKQSTLGTHLKIFHPKRYKVSFNCASSHSERM